jgi:seryl-tRNA synthetase
MLDLRTIREAPDLVKAAMDKLHVEAPIDEILRLDEDRREILTELEGLRHERNVTSEKIGKMKDQEERQKQIEAMRGVNDHIGRLEGRLREVDQALEQAMYQVPNLPHESVLEGADESQNAVIRTEGEPKTAEVLGFAPKPHWDLGPALGVIDFERGVKLSGSRFYVMYGAGARLERALISWMLDVHVRQHGYLEVYPPFVVKEMCMWGAGQLPKFRDNIYHDAEEDLWWVGTAEIPLTNLHRDEILTAESLPRNYVAYTPCFRREKFSAGRDVRGIKRGHQFDKVEMYKYCKPEDSDAELEKMRLDAEQTCAELGLTYRVLQLSTGDLGFASRITYDLEVWAPGCGEWLEASSVSNVGDFQARRANIRYRPDGGGRLQFVHTLNGSGLGLPRTLIAVLETYQQADGSVTVPEVLRPWMGGVDVIYPQG